MGNCGITGLKEIFGVADFYGHQVVPHVTGEMVLLPAMLLERLSTSTQLLANYPNPFNPKPGFPSNSVKILRLVLPFMI